MTATYPDVDPRVVRWMSRRGQGLRLSAAAAMLLAPRLRVRWWTAWVTALLVVAFWVWWFVAPGHIVFDKGPDWPYLPFVQGTLYLVMTSAILAFMWVTRWRDRQLATELPRRVTRTGAVAIRTVLGPPVCVALAAVGGVHVVILVLLARNWPAAVSLSYAGGLLVVTAGMLVVLAVVLRRPTVALDDSSLAIDERLRAQDALTALTPWWWMDMAMVGGLPRGHAGTATTLLLLAGLGFVAYFVASLAQPAEARWRR